MTSMPREAPCPLCTTNFKLYEELSEHVRVKHPQLARLLIAKFVNDIWWLGNPKYAFNVMVGDGGTDISDEEYDMIAKGQGVPTRADQMAAVDRFLIDRKKR